MMSVVCFCLLLVVSLWVAADVVVCCLLLPVVVCHVLFVADC